MTACYHFHSLYFLLKGKWGMIRHVKGDEQYTTVEVMAANVNKIQQLHKMFRKNEFTLRKK